MESPEGPTVVIRPTHGWVPIDLRELWSHRELLYFLVWRDVKVRYKQTVLGVAWAVLQPLLMMVVFTFLFGMLLSVQTGGAAYPPLVYVALLPWNLFARGLQEGSTSLVANERLITKVYFPRLVLPAAAVFAGLVDFAVGLVLVVPLLLFFPGDVTIAVLLLPVFIAIALVSALGIAFWLSAIDARYRDVRYTLSFLTQLWFFATPVVYSTIQVPSSWHWLYYLNPMVLVVNGFRWALLGTDLNFDVFSAISLATVILLFFGGLLYFRRTERIFADLV